MKITGIQEASLPIGSAMRNASIAFDQMTASALAIRTDQTRDGQPLVGLAFDSIGRYAKGGLLRERFIPRLLAAPARDLLDEAGLIDPMRCVAILMRGEKQGGHGERSGAVGLLDAALWDLRAKQMGLPLWQCLGPSPGGAAPSAHIATYASCGHFTDNPDPQALRDEVAQCLALGYTSVKIKLSGRQAALDAQRLRSALDAGLNPGQLAVDLNGQWDKHCTDALAVLAEYPLAWVEEPAAPLDYAALTAFCQIHPGPVATGENLFSADDATNLLRYGGLRPALDRLQMDISLSYGVDEYHRMIEHALALGWTRQAFWPHAGHLFAAHVVAAWGLGSHESAPDASRLYGGFWDGVPVIQGHITLPRYPGVGFEHKANLMAVLQPLC
ncbi:MAG: mandelate racemase [Betaproteobacteria bacterium]|nr:mandelate racemase [Betaproteobacteria bacterium]